MEGFNIFGENDDAAPAGITEVMALIAHHIEEHGFTARQGIIILHDMVNPGHSDSSHDVRPLWVGAMFAYGYAEVCESFAAIYLNEMPWGMGFCISVEPEFEFYALSKEAQRAVIKSLAVVLRSGGMTAEVDDQNRITVKRPDGTDETTMSVEDLISRFTEQIEEELPKLLDVEPDDGRDPTRRWCP